MMFFSRKAWWEGYKEGFSKGLESSGTLSSIEKKKIHDDAVDEILENNPLMRDVKSIKTRYEKIQKSLFVDNLSKEERKKVEHYLEAMGWCLNDKR